MSIVQLAEQPVCSGKIRQVADTENGRQFIIDLSVCNQQGQSKLTGEAWVTLPLV
ncbi:hypothetical protein ACM5Q9_05485 [Advenella sp. RU8]|uniref:hypothetical protein n=1 Tax=Advenella sp. RU8 TaxID=3399575 RepID=UPI003AAA6412